MRASQSVAGLEHCVCDNTPFVQMLAGAVMILFRDLYTGHEEHVGLTLMQ